MGFCFVGIFVVDYLLVFCLLVLIFVLCFVGSFGDKEKEGERESFKLEGERGVAMKEELEGREHDQDT